MHAYAAPIPWWASTPTFAIVRRASILGAGMGGPRMGSRGRLGCRDSWGHSGDLGQAGIYGDRTPMDALLAGGGTMASLLNGGDPGETWVGRGISRAGQGVERFSVRGG